MVRSILCLCVILLNVSHLSYSQYTVKGSLVDSLGKGISSATLTILSKGESAILLQAHPKEGSFSMNYNNPHDKELLLYIQATGYEGLVKDLISEDQDFGDIALKSLMYSLEAIAVKGRATIKQTTVRGKEEFAIPSSIGEKEFDLNSLLSSIPGLVVNGEKVTIIGRGTPIFTINGLTPRPGELENLSPRDIEKIIVDRAPSARYGKDVSGIINVVTRRITKDFLNFRISNNFIYRKEPSNISSISINNKVGRWSNYLNYYYGYNRHYYETDYTTVLYGDASKEHTRIYSQSPFFKAHSHSLNLSPKYQINDRSYVDLQYSLGTNNSRSSHPEILNIVGYELNNAIGNVHSTNEDHTIIVRYDYNNEAGRHFSLNAGYSSIRRDSYSKKNEHITHIDNTVEVIDTEYLGELENDLLSLSAKYDFKLWADASSEIGLDYAKIWNNSLTDYKGGQKYLYDTKETQAAAYFNMEHQIGKFSYQVGLRGEYLYKHKALKGVNSKPYSFLPMISLNYSFTDKINTSLYFRRTTTHPTLMERDPILYYTNKYEYVQGNPDLKSYIDNELALSINLPKNFSVYISYNFAKDPIVQASDIYDIDKRITVSTYANFPKKKNLFANVGWHGQFDFYRLFVNVYYSQTWSKSPFLESFIKYNKPLFGSNVYQTFTILKKMYLNIGLNYNTSFEELYSRINNSYSLHVNLTMALFKQKLNVIIAGDNLVYSNTQYRDQYHRIATHNTNRMFSRQLRIGITYNFNNFKDIFRKNDSNADVLERVQ